jgi:hypothetical protein
LRNTADPTKPDAPVSRIFKALSRMVANTLWVGNGPNVVNA